MWDLIVSVPDHCLSFYLAEFAAWYTYSKSGKKNVIDESDENDEEQADSVILLKGGLGYMHKRRKAAVLRFSTFKRKSDLKFRSRVMLYLPWRDEVEDMDGIENLEEHIKRNLEPTEDNEKQFTNTELDESYDRRQEEGPPTHLWDNISLSAQKEEEDAEIEGTSELRNVDAADIEENARQLQGDQTTMDDGFTV